jgi:hypothetical protein
MASTYYEERITMQAREFAPHVVVGNVMTSQGNESTRILKMKRSELQRRRLSASTPISSCDLWIRIPVHVLKRFSIQIKRKEQCFPNRILRSENKGFARNFYHNIKTNAVLQMCGILVLNILYSYTWSVIFVYKYVQLNNMLNLYPWLILIYYYAYLSEVSFFRFTYKNFIKGSVNIFRVQKGFRG